MVVENMIIDCQNIFSITTCYLLKLQPDTLSNTISILLDTIIVSLAVIKFDNSTWNRDPSFRSFTRT